MKLMGTPGSAIRAREEIGNRTTIDFIYFFDTSPRRLQLDRLKKHLHLDTVSMVPFHAGSVVRHVASRRMRRASRCITPEASQCSFICSASTDKPF